MGSSSSMRAPPTPRIAAATTAALSAPLLAFALLTGACGPSYGMIHAPVYARCAAAGVGACDEMTNSIVLFADGDVDAARQGLWRAGSRSSPEKLRAFAAALLELGASPGAEAYADSMLQVSSLLEIQADRAEKSAPPAASATASASAAAGASKTEGVRARSGDRRSAPLRTGHARASIVTAETDPTRLEGGMAAPGASPAKVVCAPLNVSTSASVSAFCIKAIEGPFVVTDLRAGAGCGDDLFVAAGRSTTPRWAILLRSSDPRGSPIHGARLAVKEGEFLFVGAQAASPAKVSADPRCSVLWSGFRPYAAGRAGEAGEPGERGEPGEPGERGEPREPGERGEPEGPERARVPRDLGF